MTDFTQPPGALRREESHPSDVSPEQSGSAAGEPPELEIGAKMPIPDSATAGHFREGESLYLLSYNRPTYLRRTLESLRSQTSEGWSVSLFQDGAKEDVSGLDAALVQECVALFQDYFPEGRVFLADSHIGCGLNKLRAFRQAFMIDVRDAGFFFEDDMVVHRQYLEQLLLLRDALKPFEQFVPYFACYGTIHDPSRVPVFEADEDMAFMEHFWGYGLFRSHWIQEYALLRPYWDYLRSVDYEKRCHDHIRRLFHEIGFAHEITSQDGAATVALCAMRRCALRTKVPLARYIGEKGMHCTEEVYGRWGFAETTVADANVAARPRVNMESVWRATAAYPAAMRALYPAGPRIENLEGKLSETTRELDEARARLDDVLRSTCWRATAPARAVAGLARLALLAPKKLGHRTGKIASIYKSSLAAAAARGSRNGFRENSGIVVGVGTSVLHRALHEETLDGIGRYSWELLKRLELASGLQTVPYSFSGIPLSGLLPRTLDAGPFEQQSFASLLPMGTFSIAEEILRGRVSIVHATDHFIPKLAGLPVVATLHDAIPLSHPEWVGYRLRTMKNLLWKHSATWASHIITVSDHSASEISRWFGIRRDIISVVPLGVGEHWHARSRPEELAAVRRRHQLPEHYFLFVGTLQPRKNILRLIEAHRTLPPELRRLAPLVVGGRAGWSCDAELKILEDGDAGQIRWLKHVPEEDLVPLFQAASAFVLPSLHEGFGLPVLEAFASGTPVVSSNAGSLPEVAGDAAVLVDPKNVTEIADAMRRVIGDRSLAESLRESGRKRARLFTWERTAGLTTEVYRKVLAQRKD